MDTMSDRVDTLSTWTEDLNARLDSLLERMDKESAETKAQFKQIDERFEKIDERFEEIDEHFVEIYERFTNQEEFNTKLFDLAYKTQQDLEDFKQQAATKDDINRIMNRLDDIMNKQSADMLERAATNHQLNRHEETNAKFGEHLTRLETIAKQHGWAV